jgi:hypothetical protein
LKRDVCDIISGICVSAWWVAWQMNCQKAKLARQHFWKASLSEETRYFRQAQGNLTEMPLAITSLQVGSTYSEMITTTACENNGCTKD